MSSAIIGKEIPSLPTGKALKTCLLGLTESMFLDVSFHNECLEHKLVKCILFNLKKKKKKTYLKTRNSVQGNGGFQTHMQFHYQNLMLALTDWCTN